MAHVKDIDTLLDLDGVVIEQIGGYWTKFEVRRISPTEGIPHGIRYSLTLHDRHGERIMGFDNAHAVDAHQLLKDFWSEVDKVLKALGIEE